MAFSEMAELVPDDPEGQLCFVASDCEELLSGAGWHGGGLWGLV